MSLFPSRAELRTYLAWPRTDLTAGLTVALVALPLALAFGVASGLGAKAGITTAVVAGAIAAIFGGSRFQVSGPTGAMTVVLIPIFAAHGQGGVLLVGLIAGVFLALAGLLRLGHHVHKLPTALIEGFTAGIALVISLQQVPTALGVKGSGESLLARAFEAILQWAQNPNWGVLALSSLTTLSLIWGGHRWPRLPLSLLAVVLGTVASQMLGLRPQTIGALPASVGDWDLGFLGELDKIWILIIPGLTVAALAALESLLSAKVADHLRADGTSHNSDRELLGQGLANLVVPFLGGVPATAALARTAVNVRSGANSRLAAVSHALILAVLVLTLAPLVSLIPLAVLAGVLIATASHMVKFSELAKTIRSSRLDALIFWVTLIATVLTDLTTAVILGGVIWLALRKSRLSVVEPVIDEDETLGD
ncbi:MAG: SulP family inorganic anion transporter [Micrococcales bacterium]